MNRAHAQWLSHVRLFTTPWTVAHQAPLSMGFPRQDYWSGLPFPPPGDLPKPGIKPESPVSSALQADSLPAEPSEKLHWLIYYSLPPSLSSFSPFFSPSFLALSKAAFQTKNLFFSFFFAALTRVSHLLFTYCVLPTSSQLKAGSMNAGTSA